MLTLVYDTETLGLKINFHEVVELGAVMIDGEAPNQKIIGTFQCYVRPDHPENAHPKALAVNGLSLDMLAKKGLDKQDAYQKFADWINDLSGNKNTKVETVCCNKVFDVPRVEAEMEELGITIPWNYRFRWDVKDMARIFAPGVGNSLQTLCKHFNIPYLNAHRADVDAEMTAKVWMRLENLRYHLYQILSKTQS